MPSVKQKIILGIGLQVIERPRELQIHTDTDEHNIVHVLYSLKKDGLVEFRTRRSAHAAGLNLTDIKLTRNGQRALNDLRKQKHG